MSLVEPDVMLNAVMGKVYNILTNGDDTVPKSEDNFFSWCTPGIPLDPNDFDFLTQGLTGVVKKAALDQLQIGEGDGEKKQPELDPALLESLRAQDTNRLYMQAESISRMFDFVPDLAVNTNDQFAAMSIMNNEGSLSQRYEYILRMSQIMESVLPDKTKAKIEKFRGLLNTTRTKVNLVDDTETEVSEPSALVNLYFQKMAAYEDAALQYNSRRIDALTADNVKAIHYWSMNANILRNRVRAAMGDWVSNGYKNDYEGINAFIDQVMQRDMALLKQQYRDDLEKARITGMASGSDFYYTTCVPGNFMTASGWTEFSFDSRDFNRSSSSSYQMKRSQTRAGGGWLGIFGGGGSTSKASGESESHVKFDSHNFSMKFSIAQVIINRPWFKTAYLNSKLWRFDENNPEAKASMVSDGGNPAKGLIPAYPTSMIVIKDLKMSAKNSEGFSDAARSWERSSASGGGAIHLGPFHFGGSHGRSKASGERSSEFGYDFRKEEMNVPGYQCIGFKCHVMPKSPDPLSSITDWV
jgi:hypothetical protein